MIGGTVGFSVAPARPDPSHHQTKGPEMSSHPEEIPGQLRREVRLLSTMLGDVLREAGGSDLLDDVERLRRATIAFRRAPTTARRSKAVGIAASFDADRAEQVARAFTCYFQLANLAEERHRVRMLREGPPREDSLPRAVATIRQHHGERGLRTLTERFEITPVLTAHPTEARRRAVVETLWRIEALLDHLEDPRNAPAEEAEIERRLREEITALWRTDQLRRDGLEPLDEVRATMALFDQTIFRALPMFCRQLDAALAPGTGARVPAFTRVPFRWGTWVGGDRDGNPTVTADVTRAAVRIASEHVLIGLEAETRRIARAAPATDRDTPPSEELAHTLQTDERRFPNAARVLARRHPDAPHRRKLALAAHRLAATRTGNKGGYAGAAEYVEDLRLVQESLARAGAARMAYGELQNLRWQAEAFGFHLAELEVRQHSEVHARALRELRRPGGAVSKQTHDVLETFAAIAEIQRTLGSEACRRYIVSFTRSARDVTNVLRLARRATGGDAPNLDVVPLFESRSDLERAPAILDDLLGDRTFARSFASRDRRLEVMLGYSDSAKEVGVLAANVALHRAGRELARWAGHRNVQLTIFHGRGGALGRGGGPTNRAILGQAAGSVAGRFKVTEQGEVAFARYGNLAIAVRHLEQLANAVLVASTPEHERTAEACWRRFRQDGTRMADASERAWRALVERPGFANYFLKTTPMREIESLRLASRPARRSSSTDLTDLRAIPWVFAWSQSRVNLSGWYGLGSGLAAVADRPGGIDRLRAMYTEWPFFTSFVENAELSLAKADLPVAELYLQLGGNPTIAADIHLEFERSLELTLATTGRDELLAGKPVLRRAIDLRNPYVDALSFLQVRALQQVRATSDERARRLVHLTIGGIAAGLQNTG
jgi:phosphoenolpyruvate carboxylase